MASSVSETRTSQRKKKRARFNLPVVSYDDTASAPTKEACGSSSCGVYVTTPHPYGVLPSGNTYFCQNNNASKTTSVLQSLCDEECWTMILAWLSPQDLCLNACGGVCRYFYVLCHQPELWRDAVCLALSQKEELQRPQPTISSFHGTWKDTWRSMVMTQKNTTPSSSPPVRVRQHVPLKIPGIYSDYLFRQQSCRSFPIPPHWRSCTPSTDIDELHDSSLTCQRFIEQYENKNRPVLLKGAAKTWPAFTKWQDPAYVANILKTSNASLRATSGTAQHSSNFTWSGYQDYCAATSAQEEGPLYLFDRTAVTPPSPLANDCPWQQNHDYFSLLGPHQRPDHTWLIAGPTRSGSVFHIDPNATHAWNACISGKKRWLLSPPHCAPPGVHPSADMDAVVLPVSLGEWMLQYYPYHNNNNNHHGRILECTAHPGDIMFVPHGWWHMVVNIGDTTPSTVHVAVTHNYVAPSNLPNVLRFLREKEDQVSGCRDREESIKPDRLYQEFVNVLEQHHPTLVQEALAVPDWTCPAWSTTSKKQNSKSTSVMEKAKDQENEDKSGFTFSFL